MKKVTTIVTFALMILALLFSTLPASTALAAKAPENVSVMVKNRTGGSVTIILNGAGGSYSFTYEPGMFEFSVPEGLYSYRASTPCGNEIGQFNLNAHKELFLACKDGREVSLSRPAAACEQMLWVGSEYQWFEPDTSYWPMLLGDPRFEAEMRCFDPGLPIAPSGPTDQ
jgi:hypothetical protein